MHKIVFNGRSSEEFGLVVEAYPSRPVPTVRSDFITIPGRAGSVDIGDGMLEDCMQQYSLFYRSPKMKVGADAWKVREWLLSAPEFAELDDSYDPEAYRMAKYVGTGDIINTLNMFGRIECVFRCHPQRWLKNGRQFYDADKNKNFYNNYQPSFPVLRITGSGNGTVVVGGVTVQLSGISGTFDIDCDTGDAYQGTTNRNSWISGNVFPTLVSGTNLINWTGGVTAVEVQPRWWTK